MAAAMATGQTQPGTDARWWYEAAYRRRILREQDFSCCTLFRAVFFDHHDDLDPDVLFAIASSYGSLTESFAVAKDLLVRAKQFQVWGRARSLLLPLCHSASTPGQIKCFTFKSGKNRTKKQQQISAKTPPKSPAPKSDGQKSSKASSVSTQTRSIQELSEERGAQRLRVFDLEELSSPQGRCGQLRLRLTRLLPLRRRRQRRPGRPHRQAPQPAQLAYHKVSP